MIHEIKLSNDAVKSARAFVECEMFILNEYKMKKIYVEGETYYFKCKKSNPDQKQFSRKIEIMDLNTMTEIEKTIKYDLKIEMDFENANVFIHETNTKIDLNNLINLYNESI